MQIKLTLLATTIALSVFVSCGTADIRPDALKAGSPSAADQAKGRALLQQVFTASGGLELYRSFGSVRAEFRDDWSTAPAPARWLFMEYDEDDHPTRLDARVNAMGNARMEFLAGPQQGEVWGVQDARRFWTQAPGQAPEFKDDVGRQLFVENVEFYLGFPFYLNSADQVTYLDEVEFEGKPHDRLFLSWNTFEPQKHVDQWIVWIDRETKRIKQMQFTVRPSGQSIVGVYYVEEYKTIQGLTIPVKLAARFNAEDPDAVHTYDFYDVRYYKEARLAEILPQGARTVTREGQLSAK